MTISVLNPLLPFVAASTLLTGVGSTVAGEHPIGDPVEINGMEIVAVHLQPVLMETMLPGMMKPADIHLEADIHAVKGNKNGFGEGDWVPYLQITYQIKKENSEWHTVGAFMPMVASDGPHYGENIKLNGTGKYRVSYHIAPPPINGFYHHTDKETGTDEWWQPFDLKWEFTYLGTGKKGGY
ncbi:MAG: iron transporter [Candidatus Thiodiazotropha sp. (ex. Lucinoma kazani)]